MGLDSYSKRNLDQERSNSQVIDEKEQMNLDPDLKAKLREAKMNIEMEKAKLREAKMNIEMEKARLERQNEYEQIVDEVNSTPVRSIDLMSVSDINLNSNQSTQQEEPIISLGQKYNEEEKQQAKENLQKNIKAGEDLLAMLEASISEYDNSDSIDEEYTPRHR